MTREEAKALLPFIQAFADGEEVQVKIGNCWTQLADNPGFTRPISQYRIKPTPRVGWVHPSDISDSNIDGSFVYVREVLDQ